MAGPNRRAALALTWRTRTDDHTPAPDTGELLAMLGLIGDTRPCPRHGRPHPDIADNPDTGDRNTARGHLGDPGGHLLVNQQPAGRRPANPSDGPPPAGKYCPPGLRRLFTNPPPATDQPTLKQPPPPPQPQPKPNRRKATPTATAKTTTKTGNGRPRPPCGTRGGVNSHRYHGEPICDPCRQARRAADAKWKRDNYHATPRGPALPCGSEAAYRRHLRAGDNPSDIDHACRQARRDAETIRRRNRRQRDLDNGTVKHQMPARCGTPSGWKRHKREHSPVCEPCRQAKRADNAAYAKQAKARARAA